MRIHGHCPDCRRAFDCNEVLVLYRGHGIAVPEGLQCPCCAAEAVGLKAASEALLDDFCCASCAGTVGNGRLAEMLDNQPQIPGNLGFLTLNDAFWLNLYDEEPPRWCAVPVPMTERLQLRAARRTPSPPRTPAIILAAGEKRCMCNKCERLVVQEAPLA